jgi:Ca2+-binding RTX toxin-like protein
MAEVTGTDDNDSLVGTDGDDHISGLGGDDILNGGTGDDVIDGGPGADKMGGGWGNDTYYVDNAGDAIYDAFGVNTVIASVSYYIPAHTQTIKLTPEAGDAYVVGNSDYIVEFIWGNQGNNLLIGNDGQGVMYGLEGNDRIYGGNDEDQMLGNQGDDLIVGGGGNDRAYGGEGADTLYGGDGDDVLYGETFPNSIDDSSTDTLIGGEGNDSLAGNSGHGEQDIMVGGPGDDGYGVDSANDLTFEDADGGIDTVAASIPGTNGGVYLWANIENLQLSGTTYFGVGNELANHIIGNDVGNLLIGGDGDDILDGGWDTANDVLYGQGGADVFTDFRGGDTIADFQPGVDKIDIRLSPGSVYFKSFADIQSHMVENNGSTAINLGGGDYVVIAGVPNSALHVEDFMFNARTDAEQPVTAADEAGEHRALPHVHELWTAHAPADGSLMLL